MWFSFAEALLHVHECCECICSQTWIARSEVSGNKLLLSTKVAPPNSKYVTRCVYAEIPAVFNQQDIASLVVQRCALAALTLPTLLRLSFALLLPALHFRNALSYAMCSCYVCGTRGVTVFLDTNTTTLREFIDKVLVGSLAFNSPNINNNESFFFIEDRYVWVFMARGSFQQLALGIVEPPYSIDVCSQERLCAAHMPAPILC